MKRLLLFLIICSIPFMIVVAVNEIPDNPEATHKYIPARCTWHCHNVTCNHWHSSYKLQPTAMKKFHKDVFIMYVDSLHGNWLGLNYGAINLLIFLVVYPVLGGWLLWRLLKKLIP